MKKSLIAGLIAVALGVAASNVNAQDPLPLDAAVPVAPAAVAQSAAQTAVQTAADAVAPAVQSVPSQPCSECDGAVVGAGVGIGLGGIRGAGIPRPGFGAPDFGARIRERQAQDRPIVEASPFANPNGSLQDWQRFKYYPYGYYPHNFSDRANMSIPKYHPGYQNFYPAPRRFHEGHHFYLDVF